MKLIVRVLFVLVAVITIVTIFKSDSSHANPPLQATIPGCEPFHSISNAVVRSCASLDCSVVRSVTSSETLCIRGVADNTDWYQIDLEPQNASSPMYYIHNSVVVPGVASSSVTLCQGWVVRRGTVATVYQCASESCAALGTMTEYEWGCAQEYSGEYADWLYLQYSDIGVNGWVLRNHMRPGSSYNPNAPTVTPFVGRPPNGGGSQIRTPGTPTVTPMPGTLTVDGQLPACQQYHVSAQSARVRTCAGIGCSVQVTLNNEEMFCVRGIVPENPEWLLVDLEPSNSDAPLYVVHRSEVLPGSPEDQEEANLFDCEPWEVASTIQIRARSCPSTTCPIVTTLPTDAWVCVRDFGGQYSEWLYIDLPDAPEGERAWVSSTVMRPLQITGTPTNDSTDATATQIQSTFSPTPSRTPSPTDSIGRTPIGTTESDITQTPSPEPTTDTVCQSFVVAVARANVRSAPSTNSDTITTLTRNTAVCVIGPAPNLEGFWMIVDLDPNNPNDQLMFMADSVLTPGEDGFTVTPNPLTPPAQPNTTSEPLLTTTPGPFSGTNSPTPIFTAIPTGLPTGDLLAQELTLASLGIQNVTLFSPIGASSFRFGIPANWFPDGNNILYLHVEYFETTPPFNPEIGPLQLISTFDVQLDDRIIASVAFDNTTLGEQTLAIPLPVDILANTTRRSHTIQMTLHGEEHCRVDSESRLLIRDDLSFFHYEFHEGLAALDLALYPRPLYNESLVNVVETAFVVLPNEPTADDLLAAASVVGGLGQLSNNGLRIRVVTASEINDIDYHDNNLLLIGQLGTNSKIDALYASNLLPSVLNDDGVLEVNGQPIDMNDGVVQVIAHPDNEKRGIVVATGQTPEALRKAALALAGPPSLLGLGGSIALVEDINPLFRPFTGLITNPDITFSELGFPEIFLTGIGVLEAEIEFTIPFDQVLAPGAYVELIFTTSELIANGQTTVSLLLNNETPISSTFIDPPENPAVLEPLRIQALIPSESVVPGQVNTLNIRVDVKGAWECDFPNPNVIWMRILGESSLHLPTQILNQSALRPLVGWFPLPFDNQPDLSDVFVSLPTEPTPSELEQAYRLVARLAANTRNGEGFKPIINLGELPPGTDLSQYHLIIIGRPTTNPLLAEINANLPQPFINGTDVLAQTLDDVTYRFPEGFEIGVIEALQSPWGTESNQRMILVLSGTGPTGQANAVATLTEDRYGRSELFGNVIFVTSTGISVVDTSLIQAQDELIEMITEIPAELQTQAAIAAQATATPNPAVTVTEGPTPTSIPTTAIVSITPLFSPSPTVPTFTPSPTIPPLEAGDTQPGTVEQPGWLNLLAIVTTGILILVGLFAGFRMIRRDNRR